MDGYEIETDFLDGQAGDVRLHPDPELHERSEHVDTVRARRPRKPGRSAARL